MWSTGLKAISALVRIRTGRRQSGYHYVHCLLPTAAMVAKVTDYLWTFDELYENGYPVPVVLRWSRGRQQLLFEWSRAQLARPQKVLPMNVLLRLIYVVAAYLAVSLACWWVYKRLGMASLDALLFSMDTIACRGRMPEPEKAGMIIQEIRWWASAQAIFGHLFIPAAISAAFASDLGPRQPETASNNPADTDNGPKENDSSEKEAKVSINSSDAQSAKSEKNADSENGSKNDDRGPESHDVPPVG